MQVTKWEMTAAWHGDKNKENELLKEGWEPFTSSAGQNEVLFRRPVGYIEVEEKVVKHNGEIKPEQIITKEVSINLDSIKKVEPEQQIPKEIQKRIDSREFDIEM